jgi:hypothetical protein
VAIPNEEQPGGQATNTTAEDEDPSCQEIILQASSETTDRSAAPVSIRP